MNKLDLELGLDSKELKAAEQQAKKDYDGKSKKKVSKHIKPARKS